MWIGHCVEIVVCVTNPAPGSKSSQILAALQWKSDPASASLNDDRAADLNPMGLLIANDATYERCVLLAGHVSTFSRAVLSSNPTHFLAHLILDTKAQSLTLPHHHKS